MAISLRRNCQTPGFRTNSVSVVTTLVDENTYPDIAIAQLFRRRWQVELNFRDLKTTLGLDVLRTRTPAMIEKEVHLQAFAYNLLRALMLHAAHRHHTRPDRLSFKGTVSTLRAFMPVAPARHSIASERYGDLLLAIAADRVPDRPDRVEPRAVKRRPKVYQLLTRPRHEMCVSDSRRQK